MSEPQLILASKSPRRIQLLQEAGFTALVREPSLDDARLPRGDVSPAQWVLALAWFKAADVALRTSEEAHILAADTLCVVDGELRGQPASESEARAMLMAQVNRAHEVVTGVTLLCPRGGERLCFVDRAAVSWGAVSAPDIERYVESGLWRGKAGGYNLRERVDAGWAIRCEGDPATVMGLPMKRLLPELHRRLALGRRE